MVRRLSVTVPDELWDSVSHIDKSQSALVQRALARLRAVEGVTDGMTPVELAAKDDPMYHKVLETLVEESTELREAGYHTVLVGLSFFTSAAIRGYLDLDWLEFMVKDYSRTELPYKLSEAADQFLEIRCLHGDHGEWLNRQLIPDDLFAVCDERANGVGRKWGPSDLRLFYGMAGIIISQVVGIKQDPPRDTRLSHGANEAQVFEFTPDEQPSTRIPLSFFEGMAAAIFDTVETVKRRVQAENSPTRPTENGES